MAPKRATWSGPTEPMVAIFAEHFAHGPNALQYSEKLDCKLDVNKILPHRGLWRKIREIVPNLSFVQSAMVKVFRETYEVVKSGWPKEFSDTELADWSTKMSKRVRSQGRAIAQATAKNPRVGWLLQLWKGPLPVAGKAAASGTKTEKLEVEVKTEKNEMKVNRDGGGKHDNDGEDAEGEGGEEEKRDHDEETEEEDENDGSPEEEVDDGPQSDWPAASAAQYPSATGAEHDGVRKRPAAAMPATSVGTSPEYVLGFDNETNFAWRQLPGKRKELTNDFVIDRSEGSKDELCTVRFQNGEEYKIPGLTNDRAVGFVDLATVVRGGLWHGKHRKTGNALSINPKADRTPLLVLYEYQDSSDRKQVCMVTIKKFVKEKGEDVGDEAKAAALKCLIEIATEYMNDEISLTDLYLVRDKKMEDLGASLPRTAAPRRKVIGKRPACAVDEATPKQGQPKPKKPRRETPQATADTSIDSDLPPVNILEEATSALHDLLF